VPMSRLPLLGVFNPFLSEMAEMRFQWDRPYRVDASKFTRRIWSVRRRMIWNRRPNFGAEVWGSSGSGYAA